MSSRAEVAPARPDAPILLLTKLHPPVVPAQTKLHPPVVPAQTDTATAALESLARSNLFLVPLDDRQRWFRFHHLFAQILRVELERREP